MLVTKTLKITPTNKNSSYYHQKGYIFKLGEEIEISTMDLPPNSKIKILVNCDKCGKPQEITFFSYFRNISNRGYYSCRSSCSSNKARETNQERYGKDSFTQTSEYIEKTKSTKKDRYGDENYVNIEKQKKTNTERFGEDSYMKTQEFRDKSKKTMEKNLGVDHPSKSKTIQEHKKKTNQDRYGCDYPAQNLEIQEKTEKTKEEKYGDKYYNRKKYRETCTEKFGCENPMQNEIILQRFNNLFFEKYGVYYPAQYEEFYQKMLKSGYKIHHYLDSNLYYQGTYELDFLNRYYSSEKIERGPTIKYLFENHEHIYFSDFYLSELNLIVEIKSTKWFNEHRDKNLIKQKSCRKQGYNFIFILDKDYSSFEDLISQL